MANYNSEFCKGCPYCPPKAEQCSVPRPLSKESNNANTLLIFQAPGAKEWAVGRPLINEDARSAGGRLKKAWSNKKKCRKDFDITNAVQCYPGKRKNSNRDARPLMAAQLHCQQWLAKDIKEREYLKIIVFGSLARKTIDRLNLRDDRFVFLKHPSGGLSNEDLENAIKD